MERIESVWEFVEMYYPNYHKSFEIMWNEDMTKIVHGELNGDAELTYNEMIEDGMTHNEIIDWAKNELTESNKYIFECAIQGFINQQKP